MFNKDNDPFGGFGGHRGMGGFRAGRGMVEPAILHVLELKPMHGYEIISTLEEQSHGVWRPSAGSIYPTLQLLEEKGMIKSAEKDGKKVYELTDDGRDESRNNAERHNNAWEGRTGHFKQMRQFHEDIGTAMMYMRSISRKGTEEQKLALGEAVKAFRQRLAIISEEL